MSDSKPCRFPRAMALLDALPKAAILRWLQESEIGRDALTALELKLTRQDRDTGKPQPD